MWGESISFILRRRQEAVRVEAFSPHDLRRSLTSQLLGNGVDVFTVQHLAGHAVPSTTAKYDRRGEATKRQAAKHFCIPGICAHTQTVSSLRKSARR